MIQGDWGKLHIDSFSKVITQTGMLLADDSSDAWVLLKTYGISYWHEQEDIAGIISPAQPDCFLVVKSEVTKQRQLQSEKLEAIGTFARLDESTSWPVSASNNLGSPMVFFSSLPICR